MATRWQNSTKNATRGRAAQRPPGTAFPQGGVRTGRRESSRGPSWHTRRPPARPLDGGPATPSLPGPAPGSEVTGEDLSLRWPHAPLCCGLCPQPPAPRAGARPVRDQPGHRSPGPGKVDQRAECGFRFESGSPGPTPQSARARRMQQALHKGRSLGPDFEPTFLGRRRDFLFEPLELTRRRQTNGQSVLHARPQDRGGSRLRSRGAQIGRARERGESVKTRAASDHEAPFSPRISGLEIHPETGFRERRDRKREGRRGATSSTTRRPR